MGKQLSREGSGRWTADGAQRVRSWHAAAERNRAVSCGTWLLSSAPNRHKNMVDILIPPALPQRKETYAGKTATGPPVTAAGYTLS